MTFDTFSFLLGGIFGFIAHKVAWLFCEKCRRRAVEKDSDPHQDSWDRQHG